MSYHHAVIVEDLGPLACCTAQRHLHNTRYAGNKLIVDPTRRQSKIMVCRFCGTSRTLFGVAIVSGSWHRPPRQFIDAGVLDIDEGIDPTIQPNAIS